jgi:general secretion pathway protein K
MDSRCVRRTRQRGVAVVTALLLTTLAVTIVASLFWQQQVQVRSIENQRLQLQKQWILRGALDWARLILRENARLSQYDALDQPWAVPLQETRLGQYVENDRSDSEGSEGSDATLSGQMVDAQSMYNLNNLAANGVPVPKEVRVFARLLGNLRLNPSLAQDAAVVIAASTAKQGLGGPGAGPPPQKVDPTTGLPLVENGDGVPNPAQAPPVVVPSGPPMLAMTQVEDLLAVPGFTPEAVETLRNLVIFLPRAGTKVNINTAPPEVLAAVIEDISASDAAVIVATRTTASFRNSGDFALRLPGIPSVGSSNLGVASDFFLVNGKVRLNRAALQIQALIMRTGRGQAPKTEVIWTREN